MISNMLRRFQDSLQCPECAGRLSFSANEATCEGCKKKYARKGEAILFLPEQYNREEDNSFMLALKNFLKRHSWLWFSLYYTLGFFSGKTAAKAIKNISEGKLIINIASGTKVIRKDIVNLDVYPLENVTVVADAARLPFKDNSVDAILCESSFEHFKQAEKVRDEIRRVLKPQGLVYASVPFICGFHAAPNDYHRWTKKGVEAFFQDFKTQEIGIGWGPTYALTWTLREWLATVLSFNIVFLQQILVLFFTVLFAPLNFLDIIFSRYKTAENIAYGFYYIGAKK